jgi:hypothetical protein
MNRCTPQHLGFVSSSSSSSSPASTASEGNGHVQPAAAVRLHFVLHLPSCAKAVLCAAKNLWLKANVSQITHAANFISKTDMCMCILDSELRVSQQITNLLKPPQGPVEPHLPAPLFLAAGGGGGGARSAAFAGGHPNQKSMLAPLFPRILHTGRRYVCM